MVLISDQQWSSRYRISVPTNFRQSYWLIKLQPNSRVLTGKVLLEAAVSSDHPLGARLCEDGDVLARLVTELSQPAAKVCRLLVEVSVRQPLVLAHYILQSNIKLVLLLNPGGQYVPASCKSYLRLFWSGATLISMVPITKSSVNNKIREG